MKPSVAVALMVLGLFALMACAWVALFYAADRAQVQSVPLPPLSATESEGS